MRVKIQDLKSSKYHLQVQVGSFTIIRKVTNQTTLPQPDFEKYKNLSQAWHIDEELFNRECDEYFF